MSTMTRTRRPAAKKSRARKELPESVAPRAAARENEAPDRGADPSHREAPESGRVKIAEAPDAGDGRQAYIETEFTHGRSQS